MLTDGSSVKFKIEPDDEDMGKGAGNAVNVEVFTNIVTAQTHLIEQQRVLIDWLSDIRSAQKAPAQSIRVFVILLPTVIVLTLLLVTAFLAIYKTQIFNTSDDVEFPPINPETNYSILTYPVYFKENWGALQEEVAPPILLTPISVVIISHSDSESCKNFSECAFKTQNLQYKFIQEGHGDIDYNFLIGGEGGIYVGTGWDYQNYIRSKSVAIAFIGDFNKEYATENATKAAQALIAEGVKLRKIDPDYKLVGENQTSPLRFYSPGWNLVSVITKWDNYFNGTML